LEAERRGRNSLQLGLVGRASMVGIPVSLFSTSAFHRHLRNRFDPIFVLPVAPKPSSAPTLAPTTGRHTGTGSAALKTLSVSPTPLDWFHAVPLLHLIVLTGYTPASYDLPRAGARTFERIRKEAKASGKPVVVFPECTTSNGRGLLRFAEGVLGCESVPVRGYGVWVMCVRYVTLLHH